MSVCHVTQKVMMTSEFGAIFGGVHYLVTTQLLELTL